MEIRQEKESTWWGKLLIVFCKQATISIQIQVQKELLLLLLLAIVINQSCILSLQRIVWMTNLKDIKKRILKSVYSVDMYMCFPIALNPNRLISSSNVEHCNQSCFIFTFNDMAVTDYV